MKIFVGFGKCHKIKNNVTTFLQQYNHNVIVLEDQANNGCSTVIEKLENYSFVDKAIIILSGDDTIKPFGCKNMEKYPRQNVVFELGYFVGKLKRENVIVITDNKDRLKLLSDFVVCYIKYSQKNKRWKKELIKELS